MRIATLILGLLVALVSFLQSCAGYALSSIASNKEMSGAGAVGILVAILIVVGSAFAIGVPTVSMIVFALAAILAILVGASSQFSDMWVWGIVATILCLMSYLGRRELKRRKAKEQPSLQVN